MNRNRLLELFVIDAMADDYEDLEQIGISVELAASQCGVPFSSTEIVETLRALIANDFVKPYRFEPKPEDVIKQFPFRGVVQELDDQSRIAKIYLDEIRVGNHPHILVNTVKEQSEYAKLKIGEKVQGIVFVQRSDSWFGDIYADDVRRAAERIPFSDPVEVPGVPSDDDIDSLWYGLAPKGRALQDSETPSDWPFDDHNELRPGWTLEKET